MNLKEYVRIVKRSERARICEEAGLSLNYMYQLSSDNRRPSLDLAKRLEIATNGLLTVKEMRQKD